MMRHGPSDMIDGRGDAPRPLLSPEERQETTGPEIHAYLHPDAEVDFAALEVSA